MKVDILAFGAHPDDVELGAAGTIAKSTAAGKKVGVIDLTAGELGTRGTPALRKKEAQKAATILKVAFRENMNFADGFFANDVSHQMQLIQKIRKYQPEIVLCNAIRDRHPDHAQGSNLVSKACFLSGLSKIETTSATGGLQSSWRPKQVLHYIQWKDITPDICLDISDFLDIKLEAVQAYTSQFYDPQSAAPETPISSKNFLESVRYRAQNLGRLVGIAAAEGFTVEKPVAVDSWEALL